MSEQSTKRPTRQVIYVHGSEVYLGRKEQAQRIIAASCIDITNVTTYSYLSYCLKLEFKNGKIDKRSQVYRGKWETTELDEKSQEFEFFEAKPNFIFHLSFSRKMKLHKLGGQPEDGFVIPSHVKVNAPFQYIAQLSNKDSHFTWLPFEKLQVCFPLHANVSKVFYDYSDPLKPTVIDTSDLDDINYPYREIIDRDTVLEFKSKHFQTQDVYDKGKYIGQLGIPAWVQYSEFPTCPKTGEAMRFVAQFDSRSTDKIKIGKSSIKIDKNDWSLSTSVGQMAFWGDGVFYIFFNANSNVLCAFIQNT